jgi:FKBP-type peptidyl-prolyl cis-trans isomerase
MSSGRIAAAKPKGAREEIVMLKCLGAAAIAVALIAIPAAPSFAQAATEKTEKKAAKQTAATSEKKMTPQQQKMKDCAAKWKEEKATKKVSGRAAYRTFMSGCLKGSA